MIDYTNGYTVENFLLFLSNVLNNSLKPIFIMMMGLKPNNEIPEIIEKSFYKYNVDIIKSNEFSDYSYKQIVLSLKRNDIVIYNGTNLNKRKRSMYLRQLKDLTFQLNNFFSTITTICCSLMFDFKGAYLDDNVIKNIKEWQPPHQSEGWDYIKFISDDKLFKKSIFKDIDDLKNYNQQNDHHSLSLGEHLLKTYDNVYNILKIKKEDITKAQPVVIAALLHDIGKPLCMSMDWDGQVYYIHHENIGAYNSFFYCATFLDDDSIIYIMNLIFWHMLPKNQNALKALMKIKDNYGEEFYDDLIILHMADESAK